MNAAPDEATFARFQVATGLSADAIPLTIGDYVIAALCEAPPRMHRTNAIGLLDLRDGGWHREAFAEARIDGLRWPALADEDEPVVLPRGSEALYLVQRVRDEAHRFAITFHRQVRGKSSIQSALDTIPGIGPKRKKALLRKFGSVKQIREADVEEIASTVGFTKALAEKVKTEL